MAQVLLTLEDSERRRRYLNARATLESLLALGALPVINENDTVATAEIRYGDNDRLAARVAQMASADCLVLLSDVDGLYSADPTPGSAARVSSARCATSPRRSRRWPGARPRGRLRRHAHQDPRGAHRRRRRAATCASPPAPPRIPLRRIEEGAALHLVRARGDAGRGAQAVDRRHAASLGRAHRSMTARCGRCCEGKSLLPAGVTAARGRFDRGDTVSVFSADGREVARGIVAYSDADAARIMGRRSREIADLLGFRGRDEMIHRDDLVLMRADAGAPRRAAPRAGALKAAHGHGAPRRADGAARPRRPLAAAAVLALRRRAQKNAALLAAAAGRARARARRSSPPTRATWPRARAAAV